MAYHYKAINYIVNNSYELEIPEGSTNKAIKKFW